MAEAFEVTTCWINIALNHFHGFAIEIQILVFSIGD
jgi:hypothetical protein